MPRSALVVVLVGVVAVGCGGSEPEPDPDLQARTPREAVEGFYNAALKGDAETACGLLTNTARHLLTVRSPPPSCEDAIAEIDGGLGREERGSMGRGLRIRQAMRITRRGASADVDLATADSSGAGIHLKQVNDDWRIEGIDPGAVDGGQPTDDPAAIRDLQAERRVPPEVQRRLPTNYLSLSSELCPTPGARWDPVQVHRWRRRAQDQMTALIAAYRKDPDAVVRTTYRTSDEGPPSVRHEDRTVGELMQIHVRGLALIAKDFPEEACPREPLRRLRGVLADR